MRLGRLLLEDKPYPRLGGFPRGAETTRWARAGVEPSTTEILADPITLLLMRADRLDVAEVESLIRVARRRALQ
jgi:hypothetical protein